MCMVCAWYVQGEHLLANGGATATKLTGGARHPLDYLLRVRVRVRVRVGVWVRVWVRVGVRVRVGVEVRVWGWG